MSFLPMKSLPKNGRLVKEIFYFPIEAEGDFRTSNVMCPALRNHVARKTVIVRATDISSLDLL